LIKLFTLDGLNFANPEDVTLSTTVDMSCAGGFRAPSAQIKMGEIEFLTDVSLGYQTGMDLVQDFPVEAFKEAPKLVQLDVSPELGQVYPARGVIFSTQKKYATNITVLAWTTRAGWMPVLRPTKKGHLSIFYRDQAWRREPPLKPWTQQVVRPDGGSTLFALTGPKGFNDATGIGLHLSEVALFDNTGTNVAKYDATRANNAIVSWATDPINMQFSPYADHEYIPSPRSKPQKKNKVKVDPAWLTDGLKSGQDNAVEWLAPAKTGVEDKESGHAIQGEVLVQFKYALPVEIMNVTIYTTSDSYIWNGSLLLAYGDGLWRPIIKTLKVSIDDAVRPHDMDDLSGNI
jgi:hypothetical protein